MSVEKINGPNMVPNNGANGLTDSMVRSYWTAFQLVGKGNDVKDGDRSQFIYSRLMDPNNS